MWRDLFGKKEHYRRLERMYQKADIHRVTECTIAVSKGRAEVILPANDRWAQQAQALNGAMYFKAMDAAAFFAASSVVREVNVQTTSFSLNFLRPVAPGEIRAVGRLIRVSKDELVAEAEAFNGEGQLVARGNGTFVRGKVQLGPEGGYE